MANAHETTEALIVEYRADADKMDAHELPQPTTQYMRIMLDRLEAAHKREIAAARREPRTWEECVTEYQKRKEAGEYGPY